MTGGSYMNYANNKRNAVLIELKTIEPHQEDVEDLLIGNCSYY